MGKILVFDFVLYCRVPLIVIESNVLDDSFNCAYRKSTAAANDLTFRRGCELDILLDVGSGYIIYNITISRVY